VAEVIHDDAAPARGDGVLRGTPEIGPYAASNASYHGTILILASAVVFASAVLTVRDGQQVIIPVVDTALPGTCTFHKLTGYPCPGCGLTRSFISVGHGQLRAAWRYNAAGLLFFAVVAFQIPYRLFQLYRIRTGRSEHCFTGFDRWVLVALVIALLLQWFCAVAASFF
jgi:hypothetical protein